MVALVFPVTLQRNISIPEQHRFNSKGNIVLLGVLLGTPAVTMSSPRGPVAHYSKLERLDPVQ
jgi:hypothetical protein